tara:strand:- start:247 stop:450 length:204 start_codon:yes stop_codon:yes gene_type:complete
MNFNVAIDFSIFLIGSIGFLISLVFMVQGFLRKNRAFLKKGLWSFVFTSVFLIVAFLVRILIAFLSR